MGQVEMGQPKVKRFGSGRYYISRQVDQDQHRYMRADGTWFWCMSVEGQIDGGTYFESEEEARAALDRAMGVKETTTNCRNLVNLDDLYHGYYEVRPVVGLNGGYVGKTIVPLGGTDKTYRIGDLTNEKVFLAAGLTNVSSWQPVLDQMEKALVEMQKALVADPAPALFSERIVAAAMQVGGLTISLPRPAGHGEVMALAHSAIGYTPATEVQGFLTSEGRFVTRVEAMKIAHRAGQEFREAQGGGQKPRSHELFSEDLW